MRAADDQSEGGIIPVSSVHVHLDQIARTAVDLIMDPGKEPRVRKSIPTLIPRESSGPPRQHG